MAASSSVGGADDNDESSESEGMVEVLGRWWRRKWLRAFDPVSAPICARRAIIKDYYTTALFICDIFFKI